MNYKNLIFDADHTLINYTADERDALKRIFDEIGLAVNDKMLDRCCYLSEFTWTETGLYDVKNERIQREYHNLYKTHLNLLFKRIFSNVKNFRENKKQYSRNKCEGKYKYKCN